MSFDEALSFSETLRDVYVRSGYTPIDVPRRSVDDRAAFVREMIGVCSHRDLRRLSGARLIANCRQTLRS